MIPELERSPGEGNGNKLQYSCLENPMGRRAWQATVYGVARVGHDLATKPLPPKHTRTKVGSGKTKYQDLPLLAPQSGCDPILISGWKSAKEVIYSRVLIRGGDKALSTLLVTLPFLSPSDPLFLSLSFVCVCVCVCYSGMSDSTCPHGL